MTDTSVDEEQSSVAENEQLSRWHQPVPKGPKRAVLLIFSVLVVLFSVSVARMDSGYGTIKGGPVYLLSGKISGPLVQDEHSAGDGTFWFTTVEVESLSYAGVVWAKLTAADLIKVTLDHGSSVGQMTAAKSSATAAAASFLGKSTPVADGALVTKIAKGSPAERAGVLLGDRIVGFANTPVVDPTSLLASLENHADKAELNLVRAGTELVLKVTFDGASKLGVEVSEHIAPDPNITFDVDTSSVGGPSAGLMMTLSFIDAASPGDLTAGMNVAGTGTINADGKVGPISGIKYKVGAAERNGAELFFIPRKNAGQELPATPSMRTVIVDNVADAVAYLCRNGATDEVCSK